MLLGTRQIRTSGKASGSIELTLSAELGDLVGQHRPIITEDEAERLGLILMRAREAVLSLCTKLDVAPESLNLDLGRLM